MSDVLVVGAGQLGRFNATICVFNLSYVGLVVAAWLGGARDPALFIACLLLANYVAAGFRVLRAGPAAVAPRIDARWIRGLLRRAVPFCLTGLAVLAHAHIDRVFMLWYLDAAALGQILGDQAAGEADPTPPPLPRP